MFRIFFIILFVTGLSLSCKKEAPGCPYYESNFIAPSAESDQLQGYVPPNAVKHPSGFFYVINNPGDLNIKPTVCSSVTVTYEGRLLPSNTFFDGTIDPVTFPQLGGLILGWQKGLPIIGKGGSIDLYIPPSMAYGHNGTTSIPPHSFLKFAIQLTGVQ